MDLETQIEMAQHNIEASTPIIKRSTDEQGWRWYTVDGHELISVTTVLDIVATKEDKDFLLSVTRENFDNIMAITAQKGTDIHADIESFFNRESEISYQKPIEKLSKLVEKHNIKPIWFEKPCYSLKYGYAGQVDALLEIDGKKCIVDFKTGKFHFKHGFQVGAYRLACIEMGIIDESVGSAIIYVPRNGDDVKLYTHKQFAFLEQRFLECLGLHRGLYPNQYRKLNYPQKWDTPLETYFKGVK